MESRFLEAYNICLTRTVDETPPQSLFRLSLTVSAGRSGSTVSRDRGGVIISRQSHTMRQSLDLLLRRSILVLPDFVQLISRLVVSGLVGD